MKLDGKIRIAQSLSIVLINDGWVLRAVYVRNQG